MSVCKLKNILYSQINIWQRYSSKEARCYRIFKNLKDDTYAVQSVDAFHPPIDEKLFAQYNTQLLELFIEIDIAERETFYPTIEEAINKFNEDFDISQT